MRIAQRIKSGLRDPLETKTEAAFKLQRLRTLSQLGKSPNVLIIGASVLDADVNPAVVDEALGTRGATFNACLIGADLPTLKSWWALIVPEVDPDVLIVEAHPAMMFPPGTMAAKLTRELAALRAIIESEPPTTLAVKPKALIRSVRSMFGQDPEIGVSRSRNDANGYLPAFGHLDFGVGSKKFQGNWYEKVEIDYSGTPLIAEYLDAVQGFAANVKNTMVVLSPLFLEGSNATREGVSTNKQVGDQVMAAAVDRGIMALDLRSTANSVEDFADPFHLRFAAANRCSTVVAESVSNFL